MRSFFTFVLLTMVLSSFMINAVTEGESQPISEKVRSEFLLTLNKIFRSECFAIHKCELKNIARSSVSSNILKSIS